MANRPKSNRRGANGRRGRMDRPPRAFPGALKPLKSSFPLTKTFRFQASNAVDSDINVNHFRSLFGLAYHSALPSNGMYRLMDGFRLIKLELHSIAAIGTSTTLEIDWATSTYGKSLHVSDTSIGVSPAHVRTAPPERSAAGFWWDSDSSNILFHIKCPAGAFLDVTMQLVLVDNVGAYFPCTNTVTDAAFIIKPLDTSLSGFAGSLLPIGYPNVILV